jgi:DNA repair protein RadD
VPSNTAPTSSTWQLRDYQRAAVNATLQHFRGSDTPACLVLPTGAGKSLIIAELARLARGRVMVLAHVKELCEQNYEKFSRCGVEAGLFVAGLGRKESSHAVTFASVQSVHRNLDRFVEPISLLVVDECHRLSDAEDSQFQQVIRHLRDHSPRLKLLGLTATPYRLGYGWIYRYHHSGKVRTTDLEQRPPFERCVYEVSLAHLIGRGYLTKPNVVDAPVAQYDFSSLGTDQYGYVSEQAVNQLLVQHERVTESIVSQVRQLAAMRRGVMLFAATVAHAKEVASYLPEDQTGLVLGDTPSAERDAVIAGFKAQKLKYLVNVSVLTTGFDAPHVDVIAILRRTESVSLFQQIAGRGLRLYPDKPDCLIIDYAGSGFNLFQPEIGGRRPPGSVAVIVPCPQCNHENQFWGVADADGHVVEHYGRRCQALVREEGTPEHATRERQCSYRFRFKECGACGAECDIAARRCPECETELVDPDDQLKAALRLKDATVLRVAGMTLSAKDERLCVTYHDEDGKELSEFFDFTHAGQRAVFQRVFTRRWNGATAAEARTPVDTAADAVRIGRQLKHPDFVVARKVKHYWRVQTRLFDYSGRFRRANELG